MGGAWYHRIIKDRKDDKRMSETVQHEHHHPNVELLAPAGDLECVKAAVAAGCDAVYLGGQQFSARAYAANFDDDALQAACDYCHRWGVKVYVTVNTLYKDSEFPTLAAFIDRLYAMGVDALIMQDLGAVALVRQYWPDLPVHASTQLTANSLDDVRFDEALGISTVILSRELGLDEIREICAQSQARIECFIHGALCVSYSGQCLMSSMLGHRSGNRGRCAQNCRLPYRLEKDGRLLEQGHLLSTKDICTLDSLPKLIEAGVASLKIEGRMKSREYVYGVTAIYRRYIDQYYSHPGQYAVDPGDVEELAQLFNRGMFSGGYLEEHSGADMMCPVHPRNWGIPVGQVLEADRRKNRTVIRFDREMAAGDGIEIWTPDEQGAGTLLNHSVKPGQNVTLELSDDIRPGQPVYRTSDKRLTDRLDHELRQSRRYRPASGRLLLHIGEPAVLMLASGPASVTVEGDVVQPAANQPLSREFVSDQIGRMGATDFSLEHLSLSLDDNAYLNRAQLNALKNEACRRLSEKLVAAGRREAKNVVFAPAPERSRPGRRQWTALVDSPEQLAALEAGTVDIVYFELNDQLTGQLSAVLSQIHQKQARAYAALPRIWRGYAARRLKPVLDRLAISDVDGFLVRSPGEYQALKDSGKPLALDITGNVINRYTLAFWRAMGVARVGLSPESGPSFLADCGDPQGAEVLVYGRLPLMVTHQCPIGNFAGGKRRGIHCRLYGQAEGYQLASGGHRFDLWTECADCVCQIVSAQPLDAAWLVAETPLSGLRLDLRHLDGESARQVVARYHQIRENGPDNEKTGRGSPVYQREIE